MAPRVVFMGSDSFSVPILTALLHYHALAGQEVTTAGVVTQPDRPARRGRLVRFGPVKQLAMEAYVPVLQPERVRRPQAVEAILALQPDVIVVASYGQILPSTLLDTPPRGAINLHPSLLPRLRGSSPMAGAILEGDEVSGSTLMLMTERMDAGPILAQRSTPIGPDETEGDLRERLARMSAGLLLENLGAWLERRIVPRPQDEAAATYTRRLTKDDGQIDWEKPAVMLAREIRAFSPWPGAWTTFRGQPLRLLRARAVEGEGPVGQVLGLVREGLLVGTGDGILEVSEVQPAGRIPMSSADFARGRRTVLKVKFPDPA